MLISSKGLILIFFSLRDVLFPGTKNSDNCWGHFVVEGFMYINNHGGGKSVH